MLLKLIFNERTIDPQISPNSPVEDAYHCQGNQVQQEEVDGVINFRVVQLTISQTDDFYFIIFQFMIDCFEED